MALIDTFILAFSTDGLDEIAKNLTETEKKVSSLEKEETQLNKTLDDGNKTTKETSKNLKDINKDIPELIKNLKELKNGIEEIILKVHHIDRKAGIANALALGAASVQAVVFANNVASIAKEAEHAQKTLEELQQENFGRVIYTKDDVNNAKEYELIMRDIRAAQTAISSNLGRMFLPILTGILKIVKNVTSFFADHYPIVNMGILLIASSLAVLFLSLKAIKTYLLGPLYRAIWRVTLAVLSNPISLAIMAIIATIAGLMLVLDDLYAWFMGGESALGGFWDKIFGGVEGAKELVNDFREAWEKVLPYLKMVGNAILWIAKKVLQGLIIAITLIPTLIVSIIAKVLQLIAWLGKIPEKIKTILHIKKEGDTEPDGSHADGLDYVPFDGYIAKLHKGERVQTASEANDWRNGLMAAKRAINFTASYPLNAIPRGAVSNAYNNSESTRTINIGDITIQTQATSAEGIANDLASAIKRAVISLDDGMLA